MQMNFIRSKLGKFFFRGSDPEHLPAAKLLYGRDTDEAGEEVEEGDAGRDPDG